MIKNFHAALIKTLPLLVIGLLLESALPIGWPRPELTTICLSVMALRYGCQSGIIFGLLCGAIVGLFSDCSPGWLAMAYAFLGGAIGTFLKPYSDRPFIYIFTVITATVVFATELTLLSICGANVPSQIISRSWLWNALLWNFVFLWPMLWFANKILGTYAFIPLELDCE